MMTEHQTGTIQPAVAVAIAEQYMIGHTQEKLVNAAIHTINLTHMSVKPACGTYLQKTADIATWKIKICNAFCQGIST